MRLVHEKFRLLDRNKYKDKFINLITFLNFHAPLLLVIVNLKDRMLFHGETRSRRRYVVYTKKRNLVSSFNFIVYVFYLNNKKT